jgi:succinylglutamate desuccinylase
MLYIIYKLMNEYSSSGTLIKRAKNIISRNIDNIIHTYTVIQHGSLFEELLDKTYLIMILRIDHWGYNIIVLIGTDMEIGIYHLCVVHKMIFMFIRYLIIHNGQLYNIS